MPSPRYVQIVPDVGYPGRVILDKVVAAEISDLLAAPYSLIVHLVDRTSVHFGFNSLAAAVAWLNRIE